MTADQLRFPLDPRHGQLEDLEISPPEWSAGAESPHRHHFAPVDNSHADQLAAQRAYYPGAVLRRAIDARLEALLDIAATTWSRRRMRSAGYGIGTFEARREARRRTALAAELLALWRMRRW